MLVIDLPPFAFASIILRWRLPPPMLSPPRRYAIAA